MQFSFSYSILCFVLEKESEFLLNILLIFSFKPLNI